MRGFVMANSAGDARGSEQLIRQKLIESGAVDVIVSVGSNFFYTVTLPCTLWFFDRAKTETKRGDQVLFIDARHIYRQIDRAHRDWLPEQIEFLANIVRLYSGSTADELDQGSKPLLTEQALTEAMSMYPDYARWRLRNEIEAQGLVAEPRRYVGSAAREAEDVDFAERLEELAEELEVLNAEAKELEDAYYQQHCDCSWKASYEPDENASLSGTCLQRTT
ncbi:MAG: N-6 DNA methylase [Halofilum sp. (in: g-proteobacteria)]|nr:N-6 DNA methylase [Halofilum sp. (in: g-proteobacteria)]